MGEGNEGTVETPPVETEPKDDPLMQMTAAQLLPEEFKGRDPAEVKLLLSQMPRIVQAQKKELEDLRLKMAGASAPTNVAPPEPTKTPEERKAEFEELFDTDPREAIKRFVSEEYGSTIGGIERRVGEAEFRLVKQQLDDFDEFEDDVRQLLDASGAPATQENIMGAYTMAVGNREIQKRQQRQRMSQSQPLPNEPAPEPTEKPKLSAIQQEVADAMGLTGEEYLKYSDEGSFELKIRT